MNVPRAHGMAKWILGILALVVLSGGCSGGSKGGSTDLIQYYSNYHPAGWVSHEPGTTGAHAPQALTSLSACLKCHELGRQTTNSAVPGCLTAGCHHATRPSWQVTDSTHMLLQEHGQVAKTSPTVGAGMFGCQICHGPGFTGGLAKTVNPQMAACQDCHKTTGPAPHPGNHWNGNGSVATHATVHPDNASVCFSCHDGTHGANPNNPPGHPLKPAPINTSPNCFNGTLCHAEAGAPHPVPFLWDQVDSLSNGHMTVTSTAFSADCATCHAKSGASPVATAPSCAICHTHGDPVSTGTHAGTCLSCHTGTAGLPGGPGGSAFPSIAGAHTKHMGLPTALTCDSCHAGTGTRTTPHYNNANARVTAPTGPAPVSMDTAFKAKSGTLGFSPSTLTCSNVSCHGGQGTPNWQNGTLNSASQCSACHTVAASAATIGQFNDAFGRHSIGTHNALTLSNNISCTTCHAMGNGSAGALAHFKYLNTAAVDGVATGVPADQMPSGTIVFDPTVVTGNRTYSVTPTTQGDGGCTLTCHSHIHTPTLDTWTSAAGAPHPIPFLGGQLDTQLNGHLTVTAAAFASDCSACHAHSGTSPVATAPLCSTCHTLANPTAAGTQTGTCLSCHAGTAGLPNGPGGSAFPSIAGSHTKHMGLPTPLSCDTCHAGSGTGTTTHYSNANARVSAPTGPAPVVIDGAFRAKSGTPGFSPSSLTCSNVSCHGGQSTPSWQNGTISSLSQCTACHTVATSAATVAQFNDAFGRHSNGTHNALVLSNSISCTTCHAMGNGSAGALAHFKYLNTPTVDGVATGIPADQKPSGTIVFDPAIVTGNRTYTVTPATEGDGGCTLTCHTHIHIPTLDTWLATGASHPVPFLGGQVDTQLNGHLTVTAAAFASDCSACHAHSGTSPVATAPLCSTCHTLANPTVTGTHAGTCLSCHAGTTGLPSGPGGSVFPSIAGSHTKHMGLPTALTCDSCHSGSGTGTTTHYNNANARVTSPVGPAPVSISSTFNAKSGTSSFSTSSLSCSNVSCHGGQSTPSWQNGLINSTAQCTACHTVATSASTTAQFNDAFGRHSNGTHNALVLSNTISCTTCHAMGNGSIGALAHFKYLNTPAVDGVATGIPADQMPSGTIVFDPAIVTGNRTYTFTPATQGDGGCTLTCHTHIHNPTLDTWTSTGAAHPIPFLGGQVDIQLNGHLTANPTVFTSDCTTCHAKSGTSPTPSAPACTICHTQGDPVGSGTGTGTCLSCHVGSSGLPAGPTGGSFPSISGAHAKHMGLPTALSCDTCHAGSGTGTTTHYNNANARVTPPSGPASVSIVATYNAQSGGSATFTPATLTCSTSSCHGGQTTPNWQSGTLNSATQCSACHAVNTGSSPAQFNDAVGRHGWGTHKSAANLDCTLCHAMNNGSPGSSAHFKYLNTPAVSGVGTGTPADQMPSDSIFFKTNNATYPITGAGTYTIGVSTPEGDGGCALTCHSQNHVPTTNHWNAPQGSGVAHPVPFLSTDVSTAGYHHQTVTLTQFNAECTNCHDQTGSSTQTGPVCTVCHTLGSPVSGGMTAGTCLSCHSGSNFTSQGPGGASWPNVKGSHTKHLSLLTFTRGTPALPASLTASAYPACEACHVGSVPYDSSQTHYSNANKRGPSPIISGPASVTISSLFNAQASTAGTSPSTSAFTCSNVSCHGGHTTPGWQSGTLTFNGTTYCTSCHTVNAAQFNAPTGRHNNPNEHNQTCDYCHVMTLPKTGAINHYKYLDTTAVSGVTGTPADQYPSDTIQFGGGSNPATGNPSGSPMTYIVSGTYNGKTMAQGRGGCTLKCHGENHVTDGNIWN